jgi:lipoyl(octanoyl) transferase
MAAHPRIQSSSDSTNKHEILIRELGLQAYQHTWQAMREFTDQRDASTLDEIWLVQHPAVFTQGVAGKAEHLLNPHHIPIVNTDRGGQVTYHGPGQWVVYPLIDIRRRGIQVRTMVSLLESAVVELLDHLGIVAHADAARRGVYVQQAKICSIGLRIRHGRSYHGLALNVDMDLTPFSYINPCGYQGLQMTQIKDHVAVKDTREIGITLVKYLSQKLREHTVAKHENHSPL